MRLVLFVKICISPIFNCPLIWQVIHVSNYNHAFLVHLLMFIYLQFYCKQLLKIKPLFFINKNFRP